ncbi:hypothetical protein SFA35_20220 [Pseudomonas sp. HR96]|uniref:hypothetical protein n=1 Tax=Pseudomonas sp. HR96 TaxID=1027966 RepID=UPI002A761D23|nr:hypothetical protein [Pseudomonas sp. HR96]WPO98919.1 hypothetical protein SFA35_20220 [Pseudomonas sp. HR96]
MEFLEIMGSVQQGLKSIGRIEGPLTIMFGSDEKVADGCAALTLNNYRSSALCEA